MRPLIPFLWLVCLPVLALPTSLAQADDPPPGTRPPNILFIFSDDHAVQAIGAYGSRVNKTPSLDRLASEGMIFDRSFCANSLCGPSRACILTGLHSHQNGFRRNGDRFDGSQWTFPKSLQQAGYQTAVIGKWHLETDPTGFDHWQVLPGQGHYYNPDFLLPEGRRVRLEGYCTDLITDLSIEWLENRDSDRPFLLMSQHKAPHRNWSPPPRHFGRYPHGSIPEPETLRDDYANRSPLLAENEMSIRDHFHWAHDMKLPEPNLYPEYFLDGLPDGEYRRMTAEQRTDWDAHYSPENESFLADMAAGRLNSDQILAWKYQRYMHDYLGCVQAVDDSIGRLLEYLDQSGLSENTLVVYASDQGFYLGEHGWYDKRWMFEESLRMPLMMRWPGVIPAGERSEALVQNIDYAPTFLEAVGVQVPDSVQGESFLPLLQGETPETIGWRESLYYAYYENAAVHNVPMHDGVRNARYKLMFFPRTVEWQLFDLVEDPQEMRSVDGDPEYAAVLAGMQQRYRDVRKFYGVNSAVIPATRGEEGWWRQRLQASRQRAQELAGEAQLVWLGDSITQGWETTGRQAWDDLFGEFRSLNAGFSGDRTEHLLWRLQHGQLAQNRPQAFVLMIGTNNTGHLMQPPEEIADGIAAVVAQLQQQSPQSHILLVGVLPRGATADDPMRLNNEAVNRYAKRIGNHPKVHYVDFTQLFVDSDGRLDSELMPDLLHLNPEGYRKWGIALRAELERLVLNE